MSKAWAAVAVLAMAGWMAAASADQSDPGMLQGTWTGPWYIGMSSGMVTMSVGAGGTGEIAFTNLDGFGEQPAALTKTSFDGKVFKLSALGAGTKELSVALQLADGGRQLRGNGKYGGFGARLELKRAD